MNRFAKETLRSARTLADASVLQAKSEVLASLTPQIKNIIEEEINREIKKSLREEKFNDIEDLEHPIPEEDETYEDEMGEDDEMQAMEDEEGEEFDIDDDLGNPPDGEDELEEGGTETISVEIDGTEYTGEYSPGDETIELQLAGEEGGDFEDEDEDPIVTDEEEFDVEDDEDDEEFDVEDDEELDVEVEDDEDTELRKEVRRIIRARQRKLNEMIRHKKVDKSKNLRNLQENAVRRTVREILIEKLSKKKVTPKNKIRKSLTIEEKLKNRGLVPTTTSSKNKLFENDNERKQVYDRLIELMG